MMLSDMKNQELLNELLRIATHEFEGNDEVQDFIFNVMDDLDEMIRD